MKFACATTLSFTKSNPIPPSRISPVATELFLLVSLIPSIAFVELILSIDSVITPGLDHLTKLVYGLFKLLIKFI